MSEGYKGLKEVHQIHSKILPQTEAKGHFVYFINFMQVTEQSPVLTIIKNLNSTLVLIQSTNSVIWNEVDYT